VVDTLDSGNYSQASYKKIVVESLSKPRLPGATEKLGRRSGVPPPPGVATLLAPTTRAGEEPVPADSSAVFYHISTSAALRAAVSLVAFSVTDASSVAFWAAT
jgi:hypothetical protein